MYCRKLARQFIAMSTAPAIKLATVILVVVGIWIPVSEAKTHNYELGPFNSSYYNSLSVISPATISNGALQITPDSAGHFTLTNRSGRVFFKDSFKLWQGTHLASFNSSFLINIFRLSSSPHPGEGFAFLISPTVDLPPNSHGQYLGLTNSTTDGLPSNRIVAIELDTGKQDFDPDDNHIGLDINSVRSKKTVSLSDSGIQIAPVSAKYYMVWVQYDGANKFLEVYIAEQKEGSEGLIISRPPMPVLTADLDLSTLVNQNSYFGFAASTGIAIQLNCVLRWNLTVEDLPGGWNWNLYLHFNQSLTLDSLRSVKYLSSRYSQSMS